MLHIYICSIAHLCTLKKNVSKHVIVFLNSLININGREFTPVNINGREFTPEKK